MVRRPKTTAFWLGRLPHWEVKDGCYFITLHLAGAIPVEGRKRLRAKSEELRKTKDRNSPKWLRLQRAIFMEMEKWLNRAERSAKLKQPDIAEMVIEAIEHRCERSVWKMFEYVIMPTHLHMFCELGEVELKSSMEEFKRWTGHRAARILGVDHKRFWQREWFDHWSRSDEEDEKIVRYIRNNPVKAGLVRHDSDWPYGSCSRSRLPGGT